jgi:hypothetical protein
MNSDDSPIIYCMPTFGRSLLHRTVYLKDRTSDRLAVTGEDVQIMRGRTIHVIRERAFNRSTLRAHRQYI